MPLRKLSAHYIFPGEGKMIPHGILSLDESGSVVDLREPFDKISEESELNFTAGSLPRDLSMPTVISNSPICMNL